MKLFFFYSKKLLTNCFGHSIISNVSDTTDNNMREWLSWWSTTLPRSGPRVRVPSRALINLIFVLCSFEHSYHARVAQLVEHDLAKVGAAGSSPVSRSLKKETYQMICLFFVMIPAGLEHSGFYVPFRSSQNRRPPDASHSYTVKRRGIYLQIPLLFRMV